MTASRLILIIGLILVAVGVFGEAFPAFRPGRLPGDLSFSAGNIRVSVPLGTSLLLSLAVTVLLAWLSRR